MWECLTCVHGAFQTRLSKCQKRPISMSKDMRACQACQKYIHTWAYVCIFDTLGMIRGRMYIVYVVSVVHTLTH